MTRILGAPQSPEPSMNTMGLFKNRIKRISAVFCLLALFLLSYGLFGLFDLSLPERERHPEARYHILEFLEKPQTEPKPAGTTLEDRDPPVHEKYGTFSLNSDLHCLNKESPQKTIQRGPYWVFQNYIKGERIFNCNETITYTTHADPTFLDNLEPLLERWQGPVSLAIYAPGKDFQRSVESILFFRHCGPSSLVKDWVSFHLFFSTDFLPPQAYQLLKPEDLTKQPVNCTQLADRAVGKLFQAEHKLDYPINVARNIAREMATTHFLFPSDIELYPSPGLIPDFLAMIQRNGPELREAKNPRVFVNAIFEIEIGQELPSTKEELTRTYAQGMTQSFHNSICPTCHKIPGFYAWLKDLKNDTMRVFQTSKRAPPYIHWEPIFIGTNAEPFYDERLSWQGQGDKMTQAYVMCVQNYDFHILSNSFLIHKPGIKSKKESHLKKEWKKVQKQKELITRIVMPQLKRIFGSRPECTL
eukprot:maker-scaffold1597_size34331-snap-gene-0.6 protein:Tk02170 transcript:maker-scaffold1597_size34331-snap-gene-0.6-mRNA-1 annotation:"n-acetyllactosaminide beta- -n-"